MIRVENLTKTFDSKTILEDINFTVNHGEIAMIYGLNGVGKTTLIKCMLGFIPFDKGIVEIKPSTKSEIGLYLSHDMLIEKLTISEYLFIAGILKGLSKEYIKNFIIEYAKRLRFEEHLKSYISKISFGTKSKVLLTASLINKPKTLILDEPFIGLDLISIKEISKILLETKKQGCSIFISSHQVDIVDDIIDKIIILKEKRIVFEKSSEDFIKEGGNKNKLSETIISYLS
ncbi:MAG: ABC transporter ATP-binding protein [Ignavibacteriae bacterium]|nr:ABC transporter ATP-binding protein [Ignavibacteriota bacterium]